MYVLQDDYPGAVQSLEHGAGLSSSYTGHDLEILSLVSDIRRHLTYVDLREKIFKWNFDGLQITVRLPHCESLLAIGRAEEAAEVLLDALKSVPKDKCADEATEKRVTGRCSHPNSVALLTRMYRYKEKMHRHARRTRGRGA